MMEQPSLSFFARLWLAFLCFWRVLASRPFAQAVHPLNQAYDAGTLGASPPAPAALPKPEREHASALVLLSMLQREGRLIDFLQESVAGFPDADVGAAARIVHEGCRKVVQQYLALKPVLPESEGARVSVPAGFDAQRIRLTGNVAGQPPYSGSLKHHGWVTVEVKFPTVSPALDPRVLAPAEVELA
jgi:hypothetical protein